MSKTSFTRRGQVVIVALALGSLVFFQPKLNVIESTLHDPHTESVACAFTGELHTLRDHAYQTEAPNTSSEPPSTFRNLESPLYDKTIEWDPTVPRLWLDYENENLKSKRDVPLEPPPAMLLLTNYGWNQPDQAQANKIPRHRRETDLVTAVVNHPWFHPYFWEQITNQSRTVSTNDRTRYYVFLDVPNYFDSHYPIYGGYQNNSDTRFGRPASARGVGPAGIVGRKYHQAKLFQVAPNRTILIIYDAAGWGPQGLSNGLNRVNGTMANLPISLATISASITNVDERMDQGLVPAAPKPAPLSPDEVKDLQSCASENKRIFLATYLGNGRSGRNSAFNAAYGGARSTYFTLSDNKKIFAARPFKEDEYQRSILSNYTYSEVLRNSIFGLAPRGDNKFSYRFTELLSAGAIPVIHADDWVWPFRPELIDWNECAVITPEKDAGKPTMAILKGMTIVERCQRRKRCYQIYKDYVETPEGTIRGIIEGLELVATKGPKPLEGVRCDAYNYSFECNMER